MTLLLGTRPMDESAPHPDHHSDHHPGHHPGHHPDQSLRWLAFVAGSGSLFVTGGALLDSPPIFLVGALGLAVAAVWSMVVSPSWTIIGFVAIRPMFDLGPTYGNGPNVNSAAGVLLLAAIGRWAWLHRTVLMRPHASLLAAAGFGAAAILSAIGSRDAVSSIQEAFRIVCAIALFAIGDQICRRDAAFLTRIVIAFVISAALATLPALAQIFGLIAIPGMEGLDLTNETLRPPGPYPAPTVLAAHLVISTALLLLLVPSLWRRSGWKSAAPYAALVGLVSLWVLLENKSRSPVGALLMVAGTFAVIRWRWAGAIAMSMVTLAAVATIGTSTVRLDEFGTGVNTGASADTFEWRTDYWRDNLPRFEDNPVTGIGLGRVQQLHIFHQPPHNVYVQTLVEMGTIGAIALIGFVVFLSRDLWIALRRTRGGPMFEVVLLAALLCLAYAFMGLFENLLTQLVTTGPLALITGCALGSARRVHRSP